MCPAPPLSTPAMSLRDELTREAVRTGAGCGQVGQRFARPSARWWTSAAIVNAMVALLATGGSTNHLIHWVAVAQRRASSSTGTTLPNCRRWCRCWPASTPTAAADVNQFQAAGGPGFVIRELLDAG
jgi:phosphogluconate dehydratase